jgi:hypothetical protein
MKSKLLIFLIVSVMVFTIVPFALAWEFDHSAIAPKAMVYLFEKTPVPSGPYPIVEGGANGKLEYNLWGKYFKFDFDGSGLTTGTSYTLIYVPDPWPWQGLICLGSAIAKGKKGSVDIQGKVALGYDLPNPAVDANAVTHSPGGLTGAKIWLVLSSDVNCVGGTLSWNPDPTKWLFEVNTLIYTFTP